MASVQVHGFRADHPKIIAEIRSDITVFPSIATVGPSQGFEYVGLWDTGATGTCITKRVVEELELSPIGKIQCSTPNGTKICNKYFVSLILPNNVAVRDASVIDVELDGGVDVLIGMDIITMGDFVISNAGNKTHFSFRTPSLGGIDVSSPIIRPSMAIKTAWPIRPSKNGRCPCGSNKKYKACCTPRFG